MHRFAAGLSAAFLIVAAMSAQAAATQKPSNADARFKAIYTKEWNWREDQFASGENGGHEEIIDHLPKVDPATQEMRLHYWENVLKQVKAIPRGQLSPKEQINYDVYIPQIEVLIANQKFRDYEAPANSDTTSTNRSSTWMASRRIGRRRFARRRLT